VEQANGVGAGGGTPHVIEPCSREAHGREGEATVRPCDREWTFAVRASVARLTLEGPAELKAHLFLLDCEVMDHLDEAMDEWPPEERRAHQIWVS
jgi:hypothetical protein